MFYIVAENFEKCGCPALSKTFELVGFYVLRHMARGEDQWNGPEDMRFVSIERMHRSLQGQLNKRIKIYKERREELMRGVGDPNCGTLAEVKAWVVSKMSVD